jgi:hypothetical protein
LNKKDYKMAQNISCPVSAEKADANAARIAAVFTTLIVTAGLFLQSYIVFAILGADFALRAFTPGKYSFIKAAAVKAVRILKLKKLTVDAAPKKFAAGLGLLFSLIIAVSFYFGSFAAAYSAGLALLFCAVLEGVFSICLGCHIYSFLLLFFKHKTVAGN